MYNARKYSYTMPMRGYAPTSGTTTSSMLSGYCVTGMYHRTMDYAASAIHSHVVYGPYTIHRAYTLSYRQYSGLVRCNN